MKELVAIPVLNLIGLYVVVTLWSQTPTPADDNYFTQCGVLATR